MRLEFAGLVITGAGLIGSGTPIICNAANIAYRKKAFEAVNGFEDQLNLSSGDDEILMQKISTKTDYKIKFCADKKAIVKTKPPGSFNEFFNQRKRWASKGLFYGDILLILKLIFIYLFYLSIPIQIILSLIEPLIYFPMLVIAFLTKMILEYSVLKKGTKILFINKILKPFIPAQFLQIPYIISAGIFGVLGNFIWKERKIKR